MVLLSNNSQVIIKNDIQNRNKSRKDGNAEHTTDLRIVCVNRWDFRFISAPYFPYLLRCTNIVYTRTT